MILKLYLFLFIILTLTGESLGQKKQWTLQECIDYGVEHSIAMRQRRLQNDDNRLNVRDATLSMLPTIGNLSTGISYSFGRAIDPETNTYTNTRSMYVGGLGFGTGITVFSGFSNINRLKTARIGRLMGLKETENQANQIAIQIMNAFFSLLYAKEEMLITQEQVEIFQMRLKKIKREYELGKKPKSDLFEMQAQQASVTFQLESAKNTYANALVNLKFLMNYEEEEEFHADQLLFEDFIPEQPDLQTEEVYRKALEELPQITLANYSLRTAKLNLQSAKASFLPSIDVSGSISFGSYSDQVDKSFFDQMTDKNRIGKGFSISMSIPFYSGLTKHSGLRRAKNTLRATELQIYQTKRELYNEIQKALQDLASCSQRYRIALERESFSNLSYTAARKRYEQGLITILDLNTTSNNLLEAKSEVLRVKFDYIMQKKMVDYYQGKALQSIVKGTDSYRSARQEKKTFK